MIMCVDDAKALLQDQFKKLGDWGQVESGFAAIVDREADTTIAALLSWYGKDIGRIKYMTLAVAEGYTAASEIILRGQVLWLLEMLNEAYQQIVDEQTDQQIAEAQKDENNR